MKFKKVANKLLDVLKEERSVKVFAGLDGFVDEIIHVVEKRYSIDDFKRYEKISDFGEKIKQAGGLSCNFEMVTKNVRLGGNGPIFANALSMFGFEVTYAGALGYPDIHPVFKPMADHEKFTALSIWEPAYTEALEFLDGKLIMGKMNTLNDITWGNLKKAVGGIEKISALLNESQMTAMLNWTMIPFMSQIWKGIIDEALPLSDTKRPYFFFDLADPAKRTKDDILEALSLLKKFNKSFKVVLGLNEKESHEVANSLELGDFQSWESFSLALYDKLGIHCLVIHPVKEAFAASSQGFFHVEGPYCENPVITTGAGDNFNAGFCLGLLMGFDVEDSLYTGVSASGYYVRNAASAEVSQLAAFMMELD